MLWMILLTIGAVLAILVYPILGSREAWDLIAIELPAPGQEKKNE